MISDEEKIALIINNMRDGQPLDNADKLFLYDFYIGTEDFYLEEREKLISERNEINAKISSMDKTRTMMFNAIIGTLDKPNNKPEFDDVFKATLKEARDVGWI